MIVAQILLLMLCHLKKICAEKAWCKFFIVFEYESDGRYEAFIKILKIKMLHPIKHIFCISRGIVI